MNTNLETEQQRIEDFLFIKEKMCENYSVPENLMEFLKAEGFFTAPASTKYHGAFEGGLYEHSRLVAMRLHVLTINNDLEWTRPESPFIIGMFHDICKCDQYIKVPGSVMDLGTTELSAANGYHYEYNQNTLLKGHGSKSVILLSQFINLTEEEMLCVRYHMGAYEKEEWSEFDMACKKYQNLLYVHLADQLASKIDGI